MERYLKLGKRDYVFLIIKTVLVAFALDMVFYRSLPGIVPSAAAGFLFFKMEKKGELEKKRNEFRLQFKEFLLLLNTGQRAGYSIENAMENSYRDLVNCFGKKAPVVLLTQNVLIAQKNTRAVNDVFIQAGISSEIEDITEFGELYELAYGRSGNLYRVMEKIAETIVDKMDTLNDVYNRLNEKIYELKVMSLMPFLIVGYISLTNPGFFDGMYKSTLGFLVMTVCLCMYTLAFVWGRRIVEITV